MIQVTEAVGRLLLNNLTNASVPPETGYRLTATRDGFRLRLDSASDKDRVVQEGDRVLLIIEVDLDKQLDGMVLDLGDDGGRAVLERASKDRSASED